MSLKGKIEAVVYAADEPVTLAQLAALFGREMLAQEGGGPVEVESSVGADASAEELPANETDEAGTPTEAAPGEEPQPRDDSRAQRLRDRMVRQRLRGILDALIAEFAEGDRGMEIREIAGGFRMATKPEYHDAVRAFAKGQKPPMKLSLQALETLAVVAYKQPVTGPEISEIRGVESAAVMGGLIGRKLVTTAGRKPVVGRPILYKTTKEFLLRFGLKDLSELPSIDEFEKMASELAEGEGDAPAAALQEGTQPAEQLPAPLQPEAPQNAGEEPASESAEPELSAAVAQVESA